MSMGKDYTMKPVSYIQGRIQKTLVSRGALAVDFTPGTGSVTVSWILHGDMYALELPLPRRENYLYTVSGRVRPQARVDRFHAAAIVRRWWMLYRYLEYKFRAYEVDLSTLEREFGQFLIALHGAYGNQYVGQYELAGALIYTGVEDLVVSGKRIAGYNDGHALDIADCEHVVIENMDLREIAGNAINLYGCGHVMVRNCAMDNVDTAVYADRCGTVDVEYITSTNIRGRDTNSDGRGQMVQFNTCNGGSVVRCFDDNPVGSSGQEDAINMFASGGTADKPIRIVENRIRGGGPSDSGGGILVGDSGGAHLIIEHNILVNPGQYGIAAAGGAHVEIYGNLIYAEPAPWLNIAIYAWAQGDAPHCGDITVVGNRVNWAGEPEPYWDGGNCGPIDWTRNEWQADLLPDIIPDPELWRHSA